MRILSNVNIMSNVSSSGSSSLSSSSPDVNSDVTMVETSGHRKRSVVEYPSLNGDLEVWKKSKQAVSGWLSPRSLEGLLAFGLPSGS